MSTADYLGDFKVVSTRVRRVLGTPGEVLQPFAGSADLDPFRRVVARGRELLPGRYQASYVDVLEEAIEQADRALATAGSAARETRAQLLGQLERVFSTLAAPIVQLGSRSHSDALKAYLAIASNLYRRFMEDETIRLVVSGKLSRSLNLDPLGFFVAPGVEPFMLMPSAELPVSFVAKPVNYSSFVPLSIVDAHEVGGHVLLSVVPGLREELGRLIADVARSAARSGKSRFDRATVRMPRRRRLIGRKYRYVPVPTFMSQLWSHWADELVADAMGVLNLGPAYVNGLMVLLADKEGLSASSSYSADGGFDTHPVDLMRVVFCLALLEQLSFTGRRSHAVALTDRLNQLAGNRLTGQIVWRDGQVVVVSVSAPDICEVGRAIACSLATSKVRALGGRSLADLMTWGSKDDSLARKIAGDLLAGKSRPGYKLEARHVVAASWLALERASLGTGFDGVADRVNKTGMEILSALYRDQCLLCEAPAIADSRRHDVASLASLLRLVDKPR